jgi:hypothetical protein
MVASGLVAAMIQRFAHVCFRKLGSIAILAIDDYLTLAVLAISLDN